MKRKSIFYSLDMKDANIDKESIFRQFSYVLSLFEFAIKQSQFSGRIKVVMGNFKFQRQDEICLTLHPIINILIYGKEVDTLVGLIESSLVELNPLPIKLQRFEYHRTIFNLSNRQLLNKLSYRSHQILVKNKDGNREVISSRRSVI